MSCLQCAGSEEDFKTQHTYTQSMHLGPAQVEVGVFEALANFTAVLFVDSYPCSCSLVMRLKGTA